MITRRAALILLSTTMLACAAMACNLPGVSQSPGQTATALAYANATATVIEAATLDAQYTAISLTQTAFAPTPAFTQTAAATDAATTAATIAATSAATEPGTATSGAQVASVGGTATQTSIANGTLKVGIEALVHTTAGGVLNMRDTPDKAAAITARLPGDTRVKIVDGPKASGGLLWWKVQVLTSSATSAVTKSGWCAESDGSVQTIQAAK